MKKETLLISILLVTVSFRSQAKAELYKWKDEKGITHYSNTVPDQGAKNVSKKAEEKVDRDEYLQYIRRQQALNKQQRIQEENELRKKEIEAADRIADELRDNQLKQSLYEQERIRSEKKLKEKEIEATSRLADEMAKSRQQKTGRLKNIHVGSDSNSIINNVNIPIPIINNINNGAINPMTGEFFSPAGDGYVGTKDGTFYAPAAGGVINTKTGQFIPVTK